MKTQLIIALMKSVGFLPIASNICPMKKVLTIAIGIEKNMS